MESIEDEAFGHLPSLKRVYGGHNKLTVWNQIWFLNSNALEIIDFQNNKIQVIPRKAFSSFKQLKEIHFENNLIESLGAGAFDQLEQLALVDFSYNRIKELKADTFPSTLKIDFLKLHQNLLNFVSNVVMKKLKVDNINIHYNPWSCLCLEKIYQWIRDDNSTLYKLESCFDETIPECVVPQENLQGCQERIDNEITQRYYDQLGRIPKYIERCRA